MKKDLKEIAAKSDKELKETLAAKREELFKHNLDNKQNKLKNTRVIFNTRKELARILTLIRERELAAVKTPKVSEEVSK
ncbi:MAG: 50S ribosomal protein L29 [Patescibacteria group bacterium]